MPIIRILQASSFVLVFLLTQSCEKNSFNAYMWADVSNSKLATLLRPLMVADTCNSPEAYTQFLSLVKDVQALSLKVFVRGKISNVSFMVHFVSLVIPMYCIIRDFSIKIEAGGGGAVHPEKYRSSFPELLPFH